MGLFNEIDSFSSFTFQILSDLSSFSLGFVLGDTLNIIFIFPLHSLNVHFIIGFKLNQGIHLGFVFVFPNINFSFLLSKLFLQIFIFFNKIGILLQNLFYSFVNISVLSGGIYSGDFEFVGGLVELGLEELYLLSEGFYFRLVEARVSHTGDLFGGGNLGRSRGSGVMLGGRFLVVDGGVSNIRLFGRGTVVVGLRHFLFCD